MIKHVFRVMTWSDSNQPVQLQNLAQGWQFWYRNYRCYTIEIANNKYDVHLDHKAGIFMTLCCDL